MGFLVDSYNNEIYSFVWLQNYSQLFGITNDYVSE